MPNCFSLTRKGETEPSKLSQIDEEICKLLGEPVHERWYCRGWFDSIGWMIAVHGSSLAEVRLALTKPCERMHGYDDDPMLCAVHHGGRFNNTAKLAGCSRSWHPGEPDDRCAELLPILDFLEANYTSSAWAEIGKRA